MDLQKSQSTKLSGLLSAGELVSKSNSPIREFLLTNASAGLKSTRTQFLCSGTTSSYFSGCNPPKPIIVLTLVIFLNNCF